MIESLGKKRSHVSAELGEQLFDGLKRVKGEINQESPSDIQCSSCSVRSTTLKDLGLSRLPMQWSWTCRSCTSRQRREYEPWPLAPSNSMEE